MDGAEKAGIDMSTVLPSAEEMAERNLLSTRYKNSQKKILIDDQIRGVRTAINILIAKERELIAESEALSPAKKERA
jgi:hypothetical protein